MHVGDTQALPGYVSFYLQLQDPNSAGSNKWDCFASYKLAVVNNLSRDLDLSRESWHRFSSRPARQQSRPLSSSSHGWADFATEKQVCWVLPPFLCHLIECKAWNITTLLAMWQLAMWDSYHAMSQRDPHVGAIIKVLSTWHMLYDCVQSVVIE